MADNAEQVLVVLRSGVPGGLGWRGVRSAPVEPWLELIARIGCYRLRSEVEDDPAWKQIIPYLVLRDGERIFLMRRTRAGGDARLHERYSIGVGGHVNPVDADPLGGLRREWHEEIRADFEPRFDFVGLLNDDDDAVGAVHLGLVFSADVEGRPVAIRETDKLSGGFATLDEVFAVAGKLETWSGLVLDFLARPREPSEPVR